MVRYLLIFFCISLICLTIMTSLSEFYLWRARNEEAAYLFERAERDYTLAIRVCPFHGQAIASYAGFLYNRGFLLGEKGLSSLTQGRQMYRRALRLDPRDARAYLALGRLEFALGENGIRSFRKAVENDPQGFNVQYAAAHHGLAAWGVLNEDERRWVRERVDFVLRVNPWYADRFIFEQIRLSTGDLRLLSRIAEDAIRSQGGSSDPSARRQRIGEIKASVKDRTDIPPVVLPRDWQGQSTDGRNVYRDGAMYWAGTMDAPVSVPPGESAVRIQASGTPANGVSPYMIVELDEEELGRVFVDSPQWREYEFRVKTAGGIKVLSVTFANDGGNARTREDRNLLVAGARVVQDER